MSKVRAIVFHQHGAPAEVARVEDVDISPVGPDEVLVRILAAPINPADLNILEGKYPVLPPLPRGPGVEGVGLVEQVGSQVRALGPGDRVLLPPGAGTWREACVVPAESLHVVPSDIPVAQAAMLRVNPATALRMMEDFVELTAGDWILQNAGNSGVGRSVIQIARSRGLRTLSLVRRPELTEELRREGADVVLLDEGRIESSVREATGDAPLRLALNSVGGESALRLATALSRGGTVVTFGAMSRQPLKIPNGLLIFQDQSWRGFWVSQWYRETTRAEHAAMFTELFSLAQRGHLRTPVERIYTLEEAAAALAHAAQSRRSGKILFGAPEIAAQPSAAHQ